MLKIENHSKIFLYALKINNYLLTKALLYIKALNVSL